MDLGLVGKRAIVTGGSRGIGKAIIETLIGDGVAVATCARGAEALQANIDRWNGARCHNLRRCCRCHR